MGIIIAIVLFSFIVIFHELGHFLMARLNGIEVEEEDIQALYGVLLKAMEI